MSSKAIEIFQSLNMTGKTLEELRQEVFEQSGGMFHPSVSTIWHWKQARMKEEPLEGRDELRPGKYVFTSAQVGAEVNSNFLASLENYCDVNDCTLYITPIKYTSRDPEAIPEPVKKYLLQRPVQVAKDLIYAGDVNVLPTASRPLSGFDSYVRTGSGILPHPKMHMTSLSRLKGEDPRFLYTTGAVTNPWYSDTKAGKIAEFHHVLGALFVQINQDGKFFVRQLISSVDTGEFHDLSVKYTPNRTIFSPVTGIVWGDLHCEDLSPTMLETMVQINHDLLPEWNICHDVLDFGGLSYHIKDNTPERARLHFAGSPKLSASASLSAVGNALATLRAGVSNIVVVPSNHDEHLKKWLRSSLDQSDFKNMYLWYRLNAEWIKALEERREFHVLKSAMELVSLPEDHDVTFMSTDDALSLHSVEVAQHGHAGPNGSRGSINGFRGVGSKIIIGHTHSAGIVDGVYTVGCMCSLDMGYNIGPSSWSHTFCVIYPNGKRALITIRNEREYK